MTMPEPASTGRGGGQTDPYARLQTVRSKDDDPRAGLPVTAPARSFTLRLRTLTDLLSVLLIVAGIAVGDTAAWLAGGRVPGLAVLGACLVLLGLLLA